LKTAATRPYREASIRGSGVTLAPSVTSSATASSWYWAGSTLENSGTPVFCNGIIRWYDPITGRWISNDPIGICGGTDSRAALARFADADCHKTGHSMGCFFAAAYADPSATSETVRPEPQVQLAGLSNLQADGGRVALS